MKFGMASRLILFAVCCAMMRALRGFAILFRRFDGDRPFGLEGEVTVDLQSVDANICMPVKSL